jgi:hypothetical protein
MDFSDTDGDSKPKKKQKHKMVCILNHCVKVSVLNVYHTAHKPIKVSVACLIFRQDHCCYGNRIKAYKYSGIMHAAQVYYRLQVKNMANEHIWTCVSSLSVNL